ncbi:unnamed protein product [Clonostachys rosea f. rosea IK726]|uniref:Uncharacterized protein n=1 Tax=Clonostachys rosea f. rosea IK726 TaxID=1349383 RepID=A0ACA9UV89_BIOOC|nr:unnamed protein product [Clonostachys rosea f. rosea IK726]
MVGVPGRSKACTTCRRRKVKCDEAKPTCQRCAKGGFECLGYTQRKLWIHTSTAPFRGEDSSESDARRIRVVAARAQAASPPSELSLIAFKDDFCISFTFANFVWRSYGSPWLEQAAQGKLGALALDATRGLSQSNFGKANHQSVVELEGVQRYSTCLNILRDALMIGVTGELLVPILIMLIHSSSNADRAGSMFHLKGIAHLLNICGPEAFQQQPLMNAFESARATLIIASLMSKQRLFLDEERWRTVPWARNRHLKTPQSELADILVIIPGILQDHSKLEVVNDKRPGRFADLQEKVKAQLTTLYQWRWRWQVRSGKLVSVRVEENEQQSSFSAAIGSSHVPHHRTRLHFETFSAAVELMIYNATLMWLLALLWKMDPMHAAGHIENCAKAAAMFHAGCATTTHDFYRPLRRPGGAITVRDPALEICRAFEWITQHHHQNHEPVFLYLFPMGMAMSVLYGNPADEAWIKGMLNRSPITASYIQSQDGSAASFGWYLTLEAIHPESVHATEQLYSTAIEVMPGDP